MIGFRYERDGNRAGMAGLAFLALLAIAITEPGGQACAQTGSPAATEAAASIESRVAEARAKSSALSPKEREAVKALFSSAFQLFQTGDFAAARLGFEDGISRDPGNAIAQFYLAETLMRLKEPATSRAHYEMAAALAPSTKEGLQARAMLAKLSAQPATPARQKFFISRQSLDSQLNTPGTNQVINDFVIRQAQESEPGLAGIVLDIVDSVMPCQQCPEVAIACPRGHPADPTRSPVSVVGGTPDAYTTASRNLFVQPNTVVPYKTPLAVAQSVHLGINCVLLRRRQ